jgi:hypothetical protein
VAGAPDRGAVDPALGVGHHVSVRRRLLGGLQHLDRESGTGQRVEEGGQGVASGALMVPGAVALKAVGGVPVGVDTVGSCLMICGMVTLVLTRQWWMGG